MYSMADSYRTIKTKIWRDKKFKAWPPEVKLLALYFLTNEFVNPSGIFEVDLDMVKLSIGINGDTFKQSFKKLQEDGWLVYDEERDIIWVVNFLRHFWTKNASVLVNVAEQLSDLPEGFIKSSFMTKYQALCQQGVSTLSIEQNRIDKNRIDKIVHDKYPQVNELYKYWDKHYVEATGEKYPFAGAKEGALFKKVYKQYGLDKAKGLIDYFFKQADVDPKCWWGDKLDVGVWYSQIPKIITKIVRG
jgi:hypothetical protein